MTLGTRGSSAPILELFVEGMSYLQRHIQLASAPHMWRLKIKAAGSDCLQRALRHGEKTPETKALFSRTFPSIGFRRHGMASGLQICQVPCEKSPLYCQTGGHSLRSGRCFEHPVFFRKCKMQDGAMMGEIRFRFRTAIKFVQW